MVTLARIALRLIEDALRWLALLFRSTEAVQAENLLLQRERYCAWLAKAGLPE